MCGVKTITWGAGSCKVSGSKLFPIYWLQVQSDWDYDYNSNRTKWKDAELFLEGYNLPLAVTSRFLNSYLGTTITG